MMNIVSLKCVKTLTKPFLFVKINLKLGQFEGLKSRAFV